MNSDLRYRLRKGDQIAGFMRKVYGGALFYSTDYFWWTGKEIQYDEIDEWTGLADKHRKPIFEWDIVKYKIDPEAEYRNGVILWQPKQSRFGIRDLDEDLFFPLKADELQLFNRDQLEVYFYLFLNPDLIDRLGLN